MLSQKIKALLATARIANVPSVVSNVLTGWVLGYLINGLNDNSSFGSVWLAILAGCCLYIGGNFLNDWSDAEWDRECRPERAIPSGIFSRRLYLGISLLLITVGLVSSLLSSMTMSIIYGLIAMFVVSYTILHKRYGASIWLMGACRAGLYFLGMAVWSDTFKLHYYYRHDVGYLLMNILLSFPLIGMLLYIAGISLLARYEAGNKIGSGTKLVAALLLLAPVMTHTCSWVSADPVFYQSSPNLLIFLGAVLFVSWTLMAILRSCNVAKKVSFLLAGIALVDSVFLWCGFIYFEGEVYHIYPLIDIQLLYPLAAFLAALLLQKIAPAT